MLTYSFSYLPVKIGTEWKMLSDADLAEYLAVKGPEGRKETVEEAKKNRLNVEKAADRETYRQQVKKLLKKWEGMQQL